MAIDMDDEILQDFLVEAGEILEQLGEQLLDLEQQPDDYDLLNAVFRGFHTIKGGAGFLTIDALVAVCHRAEDVFNILRQGQRQVDARLMDVVLQVLDVVNEMFAAVQSGEEPEPAAPALLEDLQQLSIPAAEDKPEPELIPPLEQVEAEAESPIVHKDVPPSGDEITEAEFDALLDELHGAGKHGGVPVSDKPLSNAANGGPGEEITEDEFEALLDQLHGAGKHGGVPDSDKTAAKKPGLAPVTAGVNLGATGNRDAKKDVVSAPATARSGRNKPVPKKSTNKRPKTRKPATRKATARKATTRKATTRKPTTNKPTVSTPTLKTEPKPVVGNRPDAGAVRAVAKAGPKAETTVRVDTARLDDIMNMVGELVLVRNRLATLKNKLGDEEVANAVANLDVVTADLQNSVMKTRMQPVKKVFGRFPRVVRDLARSMKKEINLEMHGEETDLDKNLVEALSDPMVHLVRNAVDHGIETPEERETAGKPRQGTVALHAAQEGDHILLSISDDGKGMDADVLRRKAVEKGMMDHEAAARLEEKECYSLIFHPGFSTKTEISDVSGRGVGMDVVKTRIAQMNGSVEIDSEWGRGSNIVIKLPLTLAILPTLMVVVGNQPFALPLASVVEIFNLDLDHTNTVDGQLTIRVRDKALPLFYLHEWLVQKGKARDDDNLGHVVVVNVGGKQVGLVVDSLIGQEEVVIKPLGSMLQGLDGMAGATITGDGKIALILDAPGLMRKYVRRY